MHSAFFLSSEFTESSSSCNFLVNFGKWKLLEATDVSFHSKFLFVSLQNCTCSMNVTAHYMPNTTTTQSCVFHTKFQISYLFFPFRDIFFLFFFYINSILVYTTFTCILSLLLCFCSIATGNSFFVSGFLESIWPLAVKMEFFFPLFSFFTHHFHHEQRICTRRRTKR